jgi:hypothetical protein
MALGIIYTFYQLFLTYRDPSNEGTISAKNRTIYMLILFILIISFISRLERYLDL